ncbi:glutathione S-transferase family protein [Sorangium sp. So ce726]|uniref:glutathione S-transferase family protein n=1 Tax=Sorangium sp. So ce726 TaxID=3133319 RepID=UPI003F61778D
MTPLTLYFAPNSISLATIIVLEEIGTPYVLARVDLAKGEQRSATYLELNPLGRVPTLRTENGLLTETPALLTFLARSAPATGLLPADAFLEARALSFLSYLASTVHVAHAHRMRGSRWSDDAEAIASMQRKVPRSVLDAFSLIEHHKLEGPWVLGEHFSVCDAHLFTLAQWLEVDGVDTTRLPRVLDHRARMLQRPATQRALAAERRGSSDAA